MFAIDFIDTDLPSVDIDNNVSEAMQYMQEEKISQLALLDGNKVLGLIEEDALYNFSSNQKLSLISVKYSGIEVLQDLHLLELADHLVNKDIEACPVIDSSGNYLGSLRTVDVFKKVLKGQFSGNGSLISLKVEQKDYSLSDISRIIETEGARIEKLYLAYENQNEYHFIIKLNKSDIDIVVNSLKRFDYKVTQINKPNSALGTDMDRYGHLMKYLEI